MSDLSIEPSSTKPPIRAPATPDTHQTRELQLLSPSRRANTGARRCKVESTLLRSPARPGYSACMRQIFDHPPLTLQQSQDVVYPALANVSRQVSPTRKHQTVMDNVPMPDKHQTQHRSFPPNTSGNVGLSRTEASHENIPPYPAAPSEAWSDDSSYLSIQVRCHPKDIEESLPQRIHEWLLQTCNGFTEPVSECPGDQTGEHNHLDYQDLNHQSLCPTIEVMSIDSRPGLRVSTERTSKNHSQRRGSKVHEKVKFSRSHISHSSLRAGQPNQDDKCRASIKTSATVVTARASTPQHCMISPLDEPDTSPLSPDVCTERGPSRYHINRQSDTIVSPTVTKNRRPSRFQLRRLQKNLTLDGGTQSLDNSH
jgi:hypothetical protein